MISVLLFFLASVGVAKAKHFQEWYRVYGPVFNRILHNNCAQEYSDYMTKTPVEGCKECLAEGVIRCILDSTGEDAKANMAAASVLLGLLPSILSLAGLRTIDTGLLAQRRPLLSFIVGVGAPAVSPVHAFDYHSGPMELLSEAPGAVDLPRFGRVGGAIVVIFEYLFAFAAVTNLLQVTIELSRRTVCTFTPSTEYLPLVWALTGILVHIVGAWACYLRARIETEHNDSIWGSLDEFRLSMHHRPAILKLRKETYWFIWWSWLVSTGTIVRSYHLRHPGVLERTIYLRRLCSESGRKIPCIHARM